ncbi:MAG: hypothetical protein WAM39_15650 [Bryobacteraceae bacterium]
MATLADTNPGTVATSRSDFARMREASLVLNTRALMQNNYLIVFCGVLIGALVYQQIHYTRLLDRATSSIMVVRTYETGEARAQRVNSFEYTPTEAEMRAFLKTAVEKHFSRIRATVVKDFSESLAFFDRPLQNAAQDDLIQTQWISKLVNGDISQSRAEVTMISIDPASSQPFRAKVFFDDIILNDDMTELKRVRMSTSVTFTMHPTGNNPNLSVNPLNLKIIDKHDDREEDTN